MANSKKFFPSERLVFPNLVTFFVSFIVSFGKQPLEGVLRGLVFPQESASSLKGTNRRIRE